MNTAWTVLLVIVGVVAVVGSLFMLGMRYKWPLVLDGVRRMNRRFMNPRQMRTAGTPGAYAGIIHHTGRTSGRKYQTPVGIVPVGDTFVIVLPYGTRPDWLKNVLAAGTATVTHEGANYTVDRPEVLPVDAVPEAFTDADRRTQRIYAVDRCLRLHVTETEGATR